MATSTETTDSFQTYASQSVGKRNGFPNSFDLLSNAVSSHDTLMLDSGFHIIGNNNQASWQTYFRSNSKGLNQACVLTAANNKLASFSKTCSQ